MNADTPEELLERGLEAWDVPEPAPDLTDRILAHNAEVLSDLAHPSQRRTETPPTMLPTDLRSSSSPRPFWAATLLGFAAAAALLLAFVAGRQSAPAPPLAPVMPAVEVQVTAPVAAPAVPPVVKPPPIPSLVDPVEPVVAPDPPELPEPMDAKPATQRRPAKPKKPRAPELKDPFNERKRSRDLKNPFSKDPAVLRFGTASGAGPARVYVDGKDIGLTPITKYEVEPGRHKVTFEWGHTKTYMNITVEAGETKVVRGSDQSKKNPFN